MPDLVCVTRGSLLARTQTGQVVEDLRRAHQGIAIDIRELTTTGDRRQDVPLPQIGGKGLFTHELEQALLSGAADFAVHSLKDLPTELPEGLALAAVPVRQEARDALVLPAGHAPVSAEDVVRILPAGAKVGTSSLRRVAFLRHHRPDLSLEPVRGNLDTRLRKLDEGQYQALILAAAGLHRLGLAERITALLPVDLSVPAPGQGALGIEARADDERVLGYLSAIDDPATHRAVIAERHFLDALGGGCQTPCGAHAVPEGSSLVLTVAIASSDGTEMITRTAVGPAKEAAALGADLAAALLASGAGRLLAEG